jgi:glycosyltransferase involved in cell wall biosynthesis
MKVALDVSAVPVKIAGAGRYIAELAAALPRNDVATTLVTRRDDADRWRRRSPDASIASIVPDARPLRLAYEALLLGTSRVARANDVWHAPHYTMPHRSSTPTVVTIHDLTFFTNPEWHERAKAPFFQRAIKYSASHARVLISVSDFSARLLDELVPNHAPTVVAPLGVDLDRFNPEDASDDDIFRRIGYSPDAPYIFFVGTMEPRKGLDVLLAAYREVASANADVELWLAGQAGWGVGPIEQRILEHPNANRIKRLGFVDDDALPALLRRARVVAYPSRGEGFGLPVLEAMACGSSVVTSADTVMEEIAGDGARLVPIGDASALADALSSALAESATDRLAWAAKSRRRAELFTWQRCIDQHLVAYDLARGR